jgi:hypothetical protein
LSSLGSQFRREFPGDLSGNGHFRREQISSCCNFALDALRRDTREF